MTDEDDPFDDLDKSLGRDVEPADTSDRATGSSDETPSEPTGDRQDDSPDPQADRQSSAPSTGQLADRPAFAFDDVTQKGWYARPEVWEEFEDILQFEIERQLRDRGHRSVEKRELTDAGLRVMAQFPESVADAVIRAREESQST